ncbi:MAG: response regulator, partial [Gammaproteobacteria bacterium]|nr:response regulator [Gammaproteobacteria bacterium]
DREALSGNQVVDIPEESIVTRDGSTRILHTKKIPIALGDDKAVYLLGISEDITQRKQAEREVRITEKRYRNVVEHAADAFFLHDMDGRFVDVNRQACVSLGYTREELLTMSVPDIEIHFDAENVEGHWSDLQKGVPQTVSGLHRRKDGTTFPVEVRLRLMRFGDERQVIAAARDIGGFLEVQTQLRDAKEAAEAANRVKSEFLANMSHEIRTPINAVVGMTDLLLRTPLGPRQQDYIRAVRNSADVLTAVIDDILDISQLEAGQLPLQTEDFAIEDVLEPVLDMLGHRAYAKGIELACRYPLGQLPMLSGDCSRIRQVLVNLVGNAVKFTDRGCVIIDISIESQTDADLTLKFTVEDTGIGIDADHKELLFAPFTQVDPSIHRDYGGVGLGLSISKRLVDLMGGRIELDEAQREGAAFWFTLRLPKSGSAVFERDVVADESMRILLIDDHPAIADATRACLASLGLQVDTATSAQAAMDRLQSAADSAPYTAVVIDVDMPGVDGVALARRIRGIPSIAATDIILAPTIAEPLPPGVVSELDARCVNKPIAPRILLRVLRGGGSAPATASVSTPEAAVFDAAVRPRVLVAEDNPVSQAVIRDMLGVLACPADSVSDGIAALKVMETVDYDVVLLDCQMPGMDGFETAGEIRRRSGDAFKPIIIAVTAYAFESDTQRCLDAGMNDVMHKPVRIESLQRVLHRWWTPDAGGDAATCAPGLDQAVWLDLRKRSAKDRTFITQLVELFRSDTEQRLGSLAAHLRTRRYNEAARTAHALRAGCLQVGAARMADLAAKLENSAEKLNADRASTLLPQLLNEFAQVTELLVREIGTP